MLEPLLKLAQESADLICENFEEPDDDWVPVLILEVEGSGVEIGQLNGELQNQRALARLIGSRPTKCAVVVQSGWSLSGLSDEEVKEIREGDGVSPADSPDRVEILLISGTDGEKDAMLVAKIKRDGQNPPTLEEWHREDVVGGGMLDAMHAGLMLAADTDWKEAS